VEDLPGCVGCGACADICERFPQLQGALVPQAASTASGEVIVRTDERPRPEAMRQPGKVAIEIFNQSRRRVAARLQTLVDTL
jgi:ferredoxin